MLKATARRADGRHLLVIGLSAGNVERLEDGQPIFFDLQAVHIPLGETLGKVAIFYGATDADLVRTVQDLIGPTTEVLAEAAPPRSRPS